MEGTCCPRAVAFRGAGRQNTSLMPTEGEEPVPQPTCTHGRKGRTKPTKKSSLVARAIKLQNIHPRAVLEGPWGLLNPGGTQRRRIYGGTNAAYPAACWVPLIGCTSLTTEISIKVLHKTSKCLRCHLLFSHPESCISCTAFPGLSVPSGLGSTPAPPATLDASHLFPRWL